jgi:hypothetical protein
MISIHICTHRPLIEEAEAVESNRSEAPESSRLGLGESAGSSHWLTSEPKPEWPLIDSR